MLKPKGIALLLVMLLLPAAAVAEDYGSMALVTYRMDRAGIVPDYLDEYMQPLGIISEDGGLRVELLDALFIDQAVAVAWTVKNTGDEPLYINDECSVCGTDMMPFYRGFQYYLLEPGEKRNYGFAGYLRDEDLAADIETETRIILHVSGSRVLGEAVNRDDVIASMPQQENFDYMAYDREVSRLFAEEGKLVFGSGGYLEPGVPDPAFQFDTESAVPYAAQRYIHTGALALEGVVSIENPLRRDVAMRSIMANEPIDVTIGGGVVRLTQAMLSPLGLIVEASFTFPDEKSALAFYNARNNSSPLPVAMIDSSGVRIYSNPGTSGFFGANGRISFDAQPIKQADGTYVWQYRWERWYYAAETDTFYLLLNTSKLTENGVYVGNPLQAADAIRIGQ